MSDEPEGLAEPDLRTDMNAANAAILNRISAIEAAMATRDPIDLPEVGVIAELATERIEERMTDLEQALSQLASVVVEWPDESIDAAMCVVQSEIGGLAVGRQVTVTTTKGSYSYDYITEGQITSEVRRRLTARGVAIWISEHESSKDGSLTTVTLDVTFVHARSGTSRTIRMTGQGTDPGDKGHTKAMTTAIRVGLCKQFLQSGDLDPEDDSYEHQAISGTGQAAPIASSPTPPRAPSGRQQIYDTFARWTGGDVDQLKSIAARLGVTSIRNASDGQLETMQDFVTWVRGQDREAVQTRIDEEGWPAIASKWYATEGSISL